jgi:hypothetical protein
MRRAALERPRTLRVWGRHLARHLALSPTAILCVCEFQPGRFRKGERVGGCGRARCYLCHGAKLLGIPTCRERVARISYHEWLAELGRNARARTRLR